MCYIERSLATLLLKAVQNNHISITLAALSAFVMFWPSESCLASFQLPLPSWPTHCFWERFWPHWVFVILTCLYLEKQSVQLTSLLKLNSLFYTPPPPPSSHTMWSPSPPRKASLSAEPFGHFVLFKFENHVIAMFEDFLLFEDFPEIFSQSLNGCSIQIMTRLLPCHSKFIFLLDPWMSNIPNKYVEASTTVFAIAKPPLLSLLCNAFPWIFSSSQNQREFIFSLCLSSWFKFFLPPL